MTFCLVLQTELLDEYADAEKGSERVMLTDASHFDRGVIGFQNASFTWSNDDVNDGALTPSRHKFTLRVDGELLFRRGCFNLIIGPTGSGKTSLLMALLGEMHFIPMTADAWYHLPRSGGVSYAAQESWVQNETIRVSPTRAPGAHHLIKSRIISYSALRTTRSATKKVPFSPQLGCLFYSNSLLVIYQCGLERDLSLFDARDETEVGEKGLTLR